MATSGPGIDIPGEWFIGSVNTTSLVLGHMRALTIDNTVSPPVVRVNGTVIPSVIPPANFAEFYALMPGDNAATIAINAPLLLPNAGAASPGSTITALSSSTFQLGPPGFYEVSWQVSVTEAAQMLLWVNSGTIVGSAGAAPSKLPRTVVGRATGTSQVVGSTIIQSTTANAVISLRNGASAAALTITPIAGGTDPVSANLKIKQML